MIYASYRLYKAFLTSSRYARKVFGKAIRSKETATFTYNLTPENESYLINLTAGVLKTTYQEVSRYVKELQDNQQLKATIIRQMAKSAYRKKKDNRCDYGNKIALYAMIRIMKPAIIVENGVEVGFTSIVLCEAVRKNAEEGHPGKFIGLDISTDAGYLIKAEHGYEPFFEMRYGDAIDSLKEMQDNIGFYFSDGLRSYEYEHKEFAALEQRLTENAVVITNKATFSKALLEFALQHDKKFTFFKEQPLDHWYEGAGLGIMYS